MLEVTNSYVREASKPAVRGLHAMWRTEPASGVLISGVSAIALLYYVLGMLALLNHAAPRHYLAATSAAIELTLLHNFFAHLHYTRGATAAKRRSSADWFGFTRRTGWFR
jgi:hypothetical protein